MSYSDEFGDLEKLLNDTEVELSNDVLSKKGLDVKTEVVTSPEKQNTSSGDLSTSKMSDITDLTPDPNTSILVSTPPLVSEPSPQDVLNQTQFSSIEPALTKPL